MDKTESAKTLTCLTWFDVNIAKEFIGKEGYFYNKENNKVRGILEDVIDSDDCHYTFLNNSIHYLYFLPLCES